MEFQSTHTYQYPAPPPTPPLSLSWTCSLSRLVCMCRQIVFPWLVTRKIEKRAGLKELPTWKPVGLLLLLFFFPLKKLTSVSLIGRINTFPSTVFPRRVSFRLSRPDPSTCPLLLPPTHTHSFLYRLIQPVAKQRGTGSPLRLPRTRYSTTTTGVCCS